MEAAVKEWKLECVGTGSVFTEKMYDRSIFVSG